MGKTVEAYFRTENDAEGAKAELQKLTVEHLLIDAIPEDADLTPIIPVQGSSNAAGGTFSYTEVLEPSYDKESEPFDKKHLTHLLQFKVKEEEYDEALKAVKNHKGYMDKKHL